MRKLKKKIYIKEVNVIDVEHMTKKLIKTGTEEVVRQICLAAGDKGENE